jgi:hypothetical protein
LHPPQLFASVVVSTHCAPHGVKPVLQENPHVYVPPEALHIGVALAGATQSAHDVPQLCTLVSSAQVVAAPVPQG